MTQRRTKIVATIGPRSRSPEVLRALIEAGVNVVRLNLAHADPESHVATAATAREQGDAIGRVVGVLADLPGPKMRTGPVAGDAVVLEAGRPFVLTGERVVGNAERVSTTVEELSAIVSPGDEIFLADGYIALRVEAVEERAVHTMVVRRGLLRSGKGMHLPGSEHRVEAFTAADRTALEAVIEMDADFVGLSFARDAKDVARVREALPRNPDPPMLVAKIETASGVENLSEIVREADAVMVARGDLGIQTPLHQVPLLQKAIIRTCNDAGKPVITATQMLESMTHSPLPSRAEVGDVANAVIDGTDALMLSEETAVGEFPIEVVRTMAAIAVAAENHPRRAPAPRSEPDDDRVSWAVAHAAVEAAEDLSVAAILCPTRSGATPMRVAAFRPSMPAIALSSEAQTLRRMGLVWGVTPLLIDGSGPATTIEDVERVVSAARAAGILSEGELVAVAAGTLGPRAGRTDYVRIVRV